MYQWDYFDEEEELHPLTDANNLYDAFFKARKGSHWKCQVQRFRWNLLEQLGKLQKELINFQHNRKGAYKLSRYSEFIVNERGKMRAITALQIRDRVVKHALNDLFLLPHIRPKLIYDNGASLKDKGVSFTRKRLKAHMESYYREVGSNKGYIMVMDFSGYYDNIDHAEAMKMVCKYEPDEFARRLVEQALDSYKVDVSYMNDEEYGRALHEKFSSVDYRRESHKKTGEKFLHKSLSVGDQTSQTIAVAFPTPIDKLVTIVCGYKYYGRYMDDLYVIAETKEELEILRDKIIGKAAEMKIIINPRKTSIMRLDRTFRFLQFKHYLAENGHVVERINPKTLTRMRRKMKKLEALIDEGEANALKIASMFHSWINNFRKYMSKDQIKTVEDRDVWLYQYSVQ